MEMESEVCNFADNITIYACDALIDTVMIGLETCPYRMLPPFIHNGMKANPSKYQVMFLGQKSWGNFILISTDS